MKRFFDILVALLGLILLFPLILVASTLIVLADGWPIHFVQTRVGLNEADFSVYKFRTMRKGSHTGPTVTVANDSRVLPYCGWLRRFKIDELPQVLNVLRGDMSIVGPRPTTRNDVDRMTIDQRRRHSVKPGITGLAQINGDTSISWPRRIEFDLEYVKQASLLTDLKIVFRTAVLLLQDAFNGPPTSHDEWSDR